MKKMKFKVGSTVKNGTSEFVILAIEDRKVLLLRKSDGEVVVADSMAWEGINENETPIVSWAYGNYYRSYMDNVLSMLEGLRKSRNSEGVYVRTSRERAEYLASFGDKTFNTALEAYADEEADYRTRNYLNRTRKIRSAEEQKKITDQVSGRFVDFLLSDDGAINAAVLDNIAAEVADSFFKK